MNARSGGPAVIKWKLLMAGAVVTAAACSESSSGPAAMPLNGAALTAAFATLPVGYENLSSTFAAGPVQAGMDAALWLGGGRDAGMDRGALMGGGLGDAFIGGIGPGHGFGHEGPFGGGLHCTGATYAAGRVACPEVTFNGLTVNRSAAYLDGAGNAQPAFDTVTTNSVNLQSTVAGTVTFAARASSASNADHGRHGWGDGRGPNGLLLGDTAKILTASTQVNSTSSQTTGGLAKGSPARTVNGASKGVESTTGTSTRGAFVASRTVGDTTTGVVVPIHASGPTYPTAGTVIRAMQASLKYSGQAATTATRREVVTYDGSATAKVVITENGATRNCTRPLPRGPLSCI